MGSKLNVGDVIKLGKVLLRVKKLRGVKIT